MYQDEISEDLLDAVNEMENEYQKFFQNKMNEYGIKSPNELSYEEKKKFFDEIEKEWNLEENEENEGELEEGFNDVYATLYNNLIDPQINKVGDIVTFPYDGYDTQFEIKLIVEPVKFGDSSNYYMKVLNGPHKDEEVVFTQEYVSENCHKVINEENEDDEEAINILDEIIGQVDEENIDLDDLLGIKEENDECEELKESTDFDITKTDNNTLEKILKMFLDKKAEDGEDYELASIGQKLILKIYNDKFINDVRKFLK